MRKITTLFLLIFPSLVFAADAPTKFSEANSLYQSGKYKDAVRFYEEAAAEEKSAAVCYNLANASFRAGQKGKALLYYKRALAITPRDEDIRWNLQILRGSLTDRIEPPPQDILLSALNRVAQRFTIDEISLLFTLFLALIAGLFCLGWRLPVFKPFFRVIRLFVFLLLLMSVVLFFLKWLDVKDPRAVVLEKEIPARYGPSTTETKAFILHEGAEGRVIDRTQEWFYLRLENGNMGWVPKGSCEIV